MSWKTFWIQEKNDLRKDFQTYPKRKFLYLLLGIFFLSWILFRSWSITFSEEGKIVDLAVSEIFNSFKNIPLDMVFTGISALGSQYFLTGAFLILTVYLLKTKRKKAIVAIFLTLFGSMALIWGFKNYFGRIRPVGCLRGWDCYSFPSGHATLSFYFYGMIYLLIARFTDFSKKAVVKIGLFLLLLVILIDLSRLYFGLHFLTDIIAGFLLGGISLLLVTILIDFFYQQENG